MSGTGNYLSIGLRKFLIVILLFVLMLWIKNDGFILTLDKRISHNHIYRIVMKSIIQDIEVDTTSLYHLNISTTRCKNVNETRELTRKQLIIACDDGDPTFSIQSVKSSFVFIMSESDHCLHLAMNSRQCRDEKYKVSNIVHFVWYGNHEMQFYAFLAIFSAFRFQNPCAILIHGDYLPTGPYWSLLLHMVPVLIFVKTTPPLEIHGQPLGPVEHKSDVTRLRVLKDYGGIYLDTDSIVLKSLNDFRNYSMTMCEAINNFNLANGVMVGEQNAPFINIWLDQYKTYNKTQWAYHSTVLPYKLSKKFPSLIHTVKKLFINPNWRKLDLIFYKNFDWKKINYTIHLYIRFYKGDFSLRTIDNMNNTLGAIARHVLYGDDQLCPLEGQE